MFLRIPLSLVSSMVNPNTTSFNDSLYTSYKNCHSCYRSMYMEQPSSPLFTFLSSIALKQTNSTKDFNKCKKVVFLPSVFIVSSPASYSILIRSLSHNYLSKSSLLFGRNMLLEFVHKGHSFFSNSGIQLS